MLPGRVDWWVCVGAGGHHDGGAFWFWYMDALSFKRSRHRWQLQLPDGQNITPLPLNPSTPNFIDKEIKLIDSSVGAAVRDVTYPPVVRTWGGWGSTCGILYRSHHRTGAGPGRAHQTSGLKPQQRCRSPKVNSRRSPRSHTCCSTCTLCTASGTSSQPPSLWEWTAGRTGGLRADRLI